MGDPPANGAAISAAVHEAINNMGQDLFDESQRASKNSECLLTEVLLLAQRVPKSETKYPAKPEGTSKGTAATDTKMMRFFAESNYITMGAIAQMFSEVGAMLLKTDEKLSQCMSKLDTCTIALRMLEQKNVDIEQKVDKIENEMKGCQEMGKAVEGLKKMMPKPVKGGYAAAAAPNYSQAQGNKQQWPSLTPGPGFGFVGPQMNKARIPPIATAPGFQLPVNTQTSSGLLDENEYSQHGNTQQQHWQKVAPKNRRKKDTAELERIESRDKARAEREVILVGVPLPQKTGTTTNRNREDYDMVISVMKDLVKGFDKANYDSHERQVAQGSYKAGRSAPPCTVTMATPEAAKAFLQAAQLAGHDHTRVHRSRTKQERMRRRHFRAKMSHLPLNDQEIYRSTYFKASWLEKEEQAYN